MAYINAAKIVTGTSYSCSFLERRAVESGDSHFITSTRGPHSPGVSMHCRSAYVI